VVRAAILLAQEAGGIVRVGDSPGMGSLARAAEAGGIARVVRETGAELADFSEPHEFSESLNTVAKRLTLTKALLDADVLVTLPKLKTHSQMTMTGALKNQYGLIPGALKGQWHFRLQQQQWLAALILDVNRTAKPALAIMDAIVAMEGPGPSSGTPRSIGALLAGADLAAVDAIACELMGLNPMRVPLLVAAKKYEFGQTQTELIQTVGDDWKALRVADFKNVEQLVDLLRLVPLPQGLLHWIRRQWMERPRIMAERCTKCGICARGCPVSPPAIEPQAEPGKQVDDARCIGCYCCHEFCPNKTIELSKPWLARRVPLTRIANKAARMAGALGSHREH
jgi:uncharacterized protein (DUF362 family)/ferredoxin